MGRSTLDKHVPELSGGRTTIQAPQLLTGICLSWCRIFKSPAPPVAPSRLTWFAHQVEEDEVPGRGFVDFELPEAEQEYPNRRDQIPDRKEKKRRIARQRTGAPPLCRSPHFNPMFSPV